ncbi:MAG TPA: glycosyltransferase [Polyangiaceae bacterium]|nr:glycosyltransferase [Polyangiaceae bacterium]
MSNTLGSPTLYLTYTGLTEPLGKSQVLPYVIGLGGRGYNVHVLSFEKSETPLTFAKWNAPEVRSFALRYHKWPSIPATALDVAQGMAATALFDLLGGIKLVHVRSYVPALMALPWTRFRDLPFLFDMRGLWPDERIESGAWRREDPSYRAAKHIERILLRQSTAVTVLTESMRRYLREEYPHRSEIRAPIWVIPTCTDLELFRPDAPPHVETANALGSARVLAYIGSLSGRYLPEEMAKFYLYWRKPSIPSRFLVVSRQAPASIRAILSSAGAESELVHCTADRQEVPGLLRCANAGIFLYREGLSTRGTSPTKAGEMLACGLPVAGNAVGDVDRILRGSGAGVIVHGTDDGSLAAAAAELSALESEPDTSVRARRLAETWFSLQRGIDAYAALYEAIMMGGSGQLGDATWPNHEMAKPPQ